MQLLLILGLGGGVDSKICQKYFISCKDDMLKLIQYLKNEKLREATMLYWAKLLQSDFWHYNPLNKTFKMRFDLRVSQISLRAVPSEQTLQIVTYKYNLLYCISNILVQFRYFTHRSSSNKLYLNRSRKFGTSRILERPRHTICILVYCITDIQ